MSKRIRDFIVNVVASVVGGYVIIGISSGGGIVIALFVAFTHGLSRWEQAGMIGCSAVVITMFAVLVYVGVSVAKVRTHALPPAPLKPTPSAKLQPAEAASAKTISKATIVEQPRIGIRIHEGFFGTERLSSSSPPFGPSSAPSALYILLDVQTTRCDTATSAWTLRLLKEGQPWMTAFTPKFPTDGILYWCTTDLQRPRKPDPAREIAAEVPARGFLLFSINQPPPELFDHILGATFVLFAYERDNTESRSDPKPPAQWLHRAGFNFLGEW